MTSDTVAPIDLTIDPPEDAKELTTSTEDEPEDLSAVDRVQQRVERFGTIAPEAKKIARASRFGPSHEVVDEGAKKRRLERFGVVPESTEDEKEKKRQRGERFNVDSPTSTIDEETKQKRVDRFGVVTPSTPTGMKNKTDGKSAPTSPVSSEAIKKRTERFGDVSEVAKTNTSNEQKAKRAERFKPITSV